MRKVRALWVFGAAETPGYSEHGPLERGLFFPFSCFRSVQTSGSLRLCLFLVPFLALLSFCVFILSCSDVLVMFYILSEGLSVQRDDGIVGTETWRSFRTAGWPSFYT